VDAKSIAAARKDSDELERAETAVDQEERAELVQPALKGPDGIAAVTGLEEQRRRF
jgi:hypothetical protein